jgi:hypothetical protein
MRAIAAILALATVTILVTPAAVAAPASSSAKDAALDAGDWRRAAELGASASDVVRALQARGQLADMVPGESVVTIGPDNGVNVVALKPLPPLAPADTAGKDVRTAGLSGSGFAFGAKPDSIVLYPAYAQTFAPNGPAPTDRFRH